jgi:hypothetical protein
MVRLMKGYEVEWCAGCPVDPESGDTDLDAADMRIKDFADLKAARRFAKKKLAEDFFGSVRITPFELQPYEPGYPGLTREYIGEPEYIE